MKKVKCEVCGGIDIKKIDDSIFECQSCGVQYSKDEVKKLLVENIDNIDKTYSTEVSPVEDNDFNPNLSFNDNTISEESFVIKGIVGVRAKDVFEIDKLLRCGEKMKAIGVYKEATGVGLAEAKEAIEKYMQDNEIRSEIKAVPKKKGWF